MDSEQVKKIEAENWKGPLNFDNEQYPKWDEFLLTKSIEGLTLNEISIINVGGGNGKEAEFLIKKGAKVVTLVDIAPNQIKSANIRKKQHNLNNLEIKLGDAENLEFNDDEFDLGYVFFSLHHFPSHQKSISELLRISNNVVFVDIMDAGITRLLNLFGLYKKELFIGGIGLNQTG